MVQNNIRLMVALMPPLLLGTIAVALATNVSEPNWRVVMMFTAVGSVAAASWRVGAAALGGTITRAHGVPGRLSMVAKRERRAPVLNEDTGLVADWYFRLRIDEEIARAQRYGQSFTLIEIRASSPEVLETVRAIAQDTLREVDFAGDLGQQVAVCLPNTSRSGAWNVVARLTEVAKGVDIRLTEFPEDGSTLAALLGGDAGQQGIRDFAV
jgi:hypothetical protein